MTNERRQVPRHDRLDWLAFSLFALAVCYQLFIPPIIGLANNGDFGKLIGWFDLGAPQPGKEFQFAFTHYVTNPKFEYHAGFLSSEWLIVALSVGVNGLVSKQGHFDMRVIGAIHALVLLAAYWLWLPTLASLPRLSRGLLMTVVAVIFSDVLYVSFLNSFFMDTGGLIFTLLSVVLLLRSLLWQRSLDRWTLLLALTMLITSKQQHALLGIPAVVFLAWKGRLLVEKGRYLYPLAAVAVLTAATGFSLKSTPPEYAAYGCYSVVFNQILPNSHNVAGDLAALGLDPSDLQYVGTHAYSNNAGVRSPEYITRFAVRLGYPRLAWFFATHPEAAFTAATVRLAEAGGQRPVLGNFDPSEGRPEFAQSKSFALWSDFKAARFQFRGERYAAYLGTLAVLPLALAFLKRRSLLPGALAALGALSLAFLIELAVCSLADTLEAPRHFLLVDILGDLLLIATIYLVIKGATPRDSSRESRTRRTAASPASPGSPPGSE